MEFRTIRRKKQALSRETCLELLRQEKRGVLAVLGDGDYPYATPIDHYYNDVDGKLYFHCGRAGHRLDALRAHDKASFCCMSEGTGEPGSWALHFQSVVVFGRVEIMDDPEKTVDITTRLSRKFTQDEAYIRAEIERSGPGTLLLVMTPEHIEGKSVTES